MPRLTDADLEQHKLPQGQYGYSAVKIEELGATEFTLVTLVNDISSSVLSYADDMSNGSAEVIEACAKSPRADNLLIRSIHFNQKIHESHGFKTLQDCDSDKYKAGNSLALKPGGTTALFDAARNAILATGDYAKNLSHNDFLVNGIVVIMTDGLDNESVASPKEVKTAIDQINRDESLESILTILVGVNISDPYVKDNLNQFKNEAAINQFVNLEDADKNTLAKLAQFVSRSISSQSQALGTGGPSQPLTL